ADETAARPIVESQNEGRDHRINEIDRQQHQGRSHEQPRPNEAPAVEVTGRQLQIAIGDRKYDLEELVGEPVIESTGEYPGDHNTDGRHDLECHSVPSLPLVSFYAAASS